jgi:hypothetical protein
MAVFEGCDQSNWDTASTHLTEEHERQFWAAPGQIGLKSTRIRADYSPYFQLFTEKDLAKYQEPEGRFSRIGRWLNDRNRVL